jgi:predicted HNH restriction endonuclease
VAYLGGKCKICGYDKCATALEFHHPDPLAKDFTISRKATWSESLIKELGKTVLLCSNCHREVHAGWHPEFLDDFEDERSGNLYEEDEWEAYLPSSLEG